MSSPRYYHTATLLPNGVLIAGGLDLPTAELYDPARGTWVPVGALTHARSYHTATLLPNRRVLVAGGWNLSSAALYDIGLGFGASWQPQIATVTSPLSLGDSLALTGSGFRGVAEGSGGNTQNSPADYPIVQFRSLESGQTLFLLSTNWQTNSCSSASGWGFLPGYALATVFVHAIPSTGAVLNISVPIPTATTLTGAKRLTNGAFQFAFTNTLRRVYRVRAP